MKRFFALMLVVAAATGVAYAKVDPSDFTVDIHVTGSTAGQTCRPNMSSGTTEVCKSHQNLKAEIDGKKYDLSGETMFPKGVLPVGDYKARITGKQKDSKQVLQRTYEILLEDGSTRKFKIVGEEE